MNFGNVGNVLAGLFQRHEDPTKWGLDQTTTALGSAAQALMGNRQDSVPAMLGAVGTNLSQSSIMNRARQEQKAKDDAFRSMIGHYLAAMPGTGVGLTADGTPGDTTVTMQKNADGTYVKTVKGNSKMTGGEQERTALTRPVSRPAQPEVGRSDFRGFDAAGLVPLL